MPFPFLIFEDNISWILNLIFIALLRFYCGIVLYYTSMGVSALALHIVKYTSAEILYIT